MTIWNQAGGKWAHFRLDCGMKANKSLHLTSDPASIFSPAITGVASNAGELRRYAA
jgi:hypothetical protein|tara:strand:- start:379 stop:546 length:168 start_codon:yes stop_codon:yes gene_type:complete